GKRACHPRRSSASRCQLSAAVRGCLDVRCPVRAEDVADRIDCARGIPLCCAAGCRNAFHLSPAADGIAYQPGSGSSLCARLFRWWHLCAYEYGLQVFHTGLVLFCHRRRVSRTAPLARVRRFCEAHLAGHLRAAHGGQLALCVARHACAHSRSPALGAVAAARAERQLHPYVGWKRFYARVVSRRRGCYCVDERKYLGVAGRTGGCRAILIFVVQPRLRLHGLTRCVGLARSRWRAAHQRPGLEPPDRCWYHLYNAQCEAGHTLIALLSCTLYLRGPTGARCLRPTIDGRPG